MQKISLGIQVVVGALLLATSVSAMVVEQHQYLQRSGEKRTTLNWQLLAGQPQKLRTRLGQEVDLTVIDDDLATDSWQLRDPQAGTEVLVQRENNRLRITGQLQGEEIARVKKIDSAPWYQTLSLSLRPFLLSRQREIVFWTLRPASLEPFKLKAVKEGQEQMEVQGERVAVSRLEISLAGLKGFMGKATYWFRTRDQLFVRYVGPSGFPWIPKTTVTLETIKN